MMMIKGNKLSAKNMCVTPVIADPIFKSDPCEFQQNVTHNIIKSISVYTTDRLDQYPLLTKSAVYSKVLEM